MIVEKSYGGKIALAIFTLIPIGFFSFIAFFMISLSGGMHYLPLLVAVVVSFYIGFVLQLFGFFVQQKRRVQLYWGIVAIVVIAASIQPMMKWIDSRVSTVSAEVNIYQYEPFVEESNIVRLDQPASLQLQDNLPIMDGATALYPLYAAVAEAVYPEKTYNPYASEVMVNQTHGAYDNLIYGNVDMIFVAGPSDQQIERAKNQGVAFHLTPIGREAFVFFVNSKNDIDELSLEQIKGIYSGELTNWSEVGGDNEKIRAFQRPADSGSQTALERLMGETPLMEAPSEDVATGMGGIIHEVSQYKNYKNAIGYTFRYYSNEMVKNNEIKLLKLNGVEPTKETIRANSYPIASEFYIVTAGEPKGNVKALIDWILSDEGQALIEEAGYVSLKEEE
ncbi:MAG: PstS family phosphate ABC transporter substrate-binding protein [Solibacillus sp.]